jgi:hypothetical protein
VEAAKKHAKTTEDFIARSRLVHGDLYDYSLVEYVRAHDKVIIIDPEHGQWEVVPYSHVRGSGHPKRRYDHLGKTTEQFIADARIVHGDLYDYSSVDYIHSNEKVTIIDPKHGAWEVTPNSHLSGSGHQMRTHARGSIVYLLEFEIKLDHFAKIGIFKYDVKTRFKGLHTDITTHFLYDFGTTQQARLVEKDILTYLRNDDAMYPIVLKGNGGTETFKVGHIPDVRTMLEQKAQEHKITVDKFQPVA